MSRWILALTFAIGGLGVAEGQTVSSGPIVISHVWARATPESAKTAVIYLTIADSGAQDDQLTGASTPVAGIAQVHSSMADGAVMKMAEMSSLVVPAGGSVELKPSATHLMLENLKQPLVEGAKFPLELTFEHAGKIEVEVLVGKVGAMSDPAAAN